MAGTSPGREGDTPSALPLMGGCPEASVRSGDVRCLGGRGTPLSRPAEAGEEANKMPLAGFFRGGWNSVDMVVSFSGSSLGGDRPGKFPFN